MMSERAEAGAAGGVVWRSRALGAIRNPVTAVVVCAIGLRLLTAGLAFLVNVLFPLDQREQFTVFKATHEFWDTFARYDSGWYHGIARNGYRFVEGGRSNLAFFPIYPLLMRSVARPFGNLAYHYYFAGIAISWVSFVVAMVLLYRVARLDLSERAAGLAVAYAAVFPFAFFYGVVYSESLFLMLMLAAVYGFRTRRWLLGGVAGALATATRVNGAMMLPALALMAWQGTRADRRDRRFAAAGVLLAGAGIVLYSAYVYRLTGSWLEWYSSLTRWNYAPWTDAGSVFARLVRAMLTRPYAFLTQDHAAPYDLLNGGAGLAFIVATPFIWKKFGPAYGLLVALNLALPVSSGQFEGLGRYCAVLFPAFIWLASCSSLAVQTSVTAVFGMLYVLCLALFVNIHPLF
jgi:hypothetical protein